MSADSRDTSEASGARAPSDPAARTLTPEHWEGILAHELSCPVRVVFTRARRTPIQVRRLSAPRRGAPAPLEVRMHAMFSRAPHDVHRAVASWIRSGRHAPRACAALDEWIARGLEELPAERRTRPEHARGARHDLRVFARELRATEFATEFPRDEDLPAITWGRRGPSRTRNSLRLGSYDPDPKLVRIHPVLDQDDVPDWFVRFVVFHELLHAAHPPTRGEDDRWVHHGPEFRRRERRYVDYPRAIEWEKRNLRALIRAARRGTPFVAAADPNSKSSQSPATASRSATSAGGASTRGEKQPAIEPPRPTPKPKERGFWQRLLFP